MPVAPFPANETFRLAELQRYAVLDTAAETAFDELAELAAHICQAPVSLVSLIDEHRQWFKSRYGLALTETPRDRAFCGYTILGDRPFIIEDATADARVSDNPLVIDDPHIRFYAGVPLTSPRGYNLGSLCIIDFVPRTLDSAQLKGLKTLAHQVMLLLEARLYAERIV
ncbi:MAG: GAF domain-containing protein, partial [Leptolyngbya sp. SIO4C1]|nr:GAF domain-containing protein [Leptolyngbya sp. SIO4C1]